VNTETFGQIDTFHIEEIVGDLEIPCDYAGEGDPSCPKDQPAEWVLFLVTCSCGVGGKKLACDTCAQNRMASEDAVYCECGEVTAPARFAYSYIEHMNRSYK
jgi:hypothetical protein